MKSTEEMTVLATASTPKLLDLGLLDLFSLGTRTGSFTLPVIELQERVAADNLLPLLWPFERLRFVFVEEECHILR